MESVDRYLHKKFKKQLPVESSNYDAEKEEKATTSSSSSSAPNSNSCAHKSYYQNVASLSERTATTHLATAAVNLSDNHIRNNIDAVPNSSTNNTNSYSLSESSSLAKSSITRANNVSALDSSEKTASLVREDDNENCKQAGELVDPQSLNSCISYVISKPSRLDNFTQRESQSRASVNFDTRYIVSEPIAISSADTSSILDNVYSKQYVTTKLVSVERGAGDISSSSGSLVSEQTNQEDCINNGAKSAVESRVQDNHLVELNTVEKSSTGKYICSYCNLACSKPSVLQKHIRAHTNERPYPCESCGFSFKTRSNLYKHCRSRTHANRVLGNKVQEIHNEVDADIQIKIDYIEQNNSLESTNEDINSAKMADLSVNMDERGSCIEKVGQDQKMTSKPYKPRFHTAKAFFEDVQKDGEDQKVPEPTTSSNKPPDSSLLSLHINDVINKNNAIVNSSETCAIIKRRSIESNHLENKSVGDSSQRQCDVIYSQFQSNTEERNHDEPLNLTNKGRKRCLSEVASEPTMATSLIKELLLKNLYADSMQCQHCKMIFQTVTELELHKLRSCKAFIKSGARYSRSSSVNVASILTKNKNAFDTIPHQPNPAFTLKSPGPFLGKTRLVESDKTKSFSFEDDLSNFPINNQHHIDFSRGTSRFASSPLTIQQERMKKTTIKLFGGEVKVAQVSEEYKKYKGDKDYDRYQDGFCDYGNRMSENRVVMSSLQSGGTVVHNKQSYITKSDNIRSSSDVLRLYEATPMSPKIDIINLEKNKFGFDQTQNQLEKESKSASEQNLEQSIDTSCFNKINSPYKYKNMVDLCQKTVQQFTPNIKQPNLTIVGVPTSNNKLSVPRLCSTPNDVKTSPSKMSESTLVSPMSAEYSRTPVINFSGVSKNSETENRHYENMSYSQKQFITQQNISKEPPASPLLHTQNVCSPLNILVNGKVVRYVPGIPGPITADISVDAVYGENNFDAQQRFNLNVQRSQKLNTSTSLTDTSSVKSEPGTPVTQYSGSERLLDNRTPCYNGSLQKIERKPTECRSETDSIRRSPKLGSLEISISEPATQKLEMKSPSLKPVEKKSPLYKNENKSPNTLAVSISNVNDLSSRKFARPNTLALKPSSAVYKQHHGLTPTIFNQILISPDTPRVAKKYIQHFLHGNYFSYLGLKSSTKTVYCTLNKTQPFYVHFCMKLSMYSEWRQQESKGEKLYASSYDSRQRQQKYVTAGKAASDLIVHSSYKFINNNPSKVEEQNKLGSILGGYESNEDYTYVRGRGRGKYVCDQCGIRCKKPSMLKKHIRTHTNDRPYTCSHCNFSFKTKGNLTKHLKSKAHTKNYAASSSSSSSSAQQSGTQSSESDTDDSGMDSSDESTRQQEHEAAYGLLSLSQKTTTPSTISNSPSSHSSSSYSLGINSLDNPVSFMNTEQVTQVNNCNFAKNKILDQGTVNLNAVKILNEVSSNSEPSSKETQNLAQFLGKCNTIRPLTYPYTSDMLDITNKSLTASHTLVLPNLNTSNHTSETKKLVDSDSDLKQNLSSSLCTVSKNIDYSPVPISFDSNYTEKRFGEKPSGIATPSTSQIKDKIISSIDERKHKIQNLDIEVSSAKRPKLHLESEAMDLSMPSLVQKAGSLENVSTRLNGVTSCSQTMNRSHINSHHHVENTNIQSNYNVTCSEAINLPYAVKEDCYRRNGAVSNKILETATSEPTENAMNLKVSSKIVINYGCQENNPLVITNFNEVLNNFYDNSAMETLADVATKQVKLERNTMAKSVASEYLKLATKQELQANDGARDATNFVASPKDVNELIVKPEENRNCSVCSKTFSKSSQLRLHMNIHYLERPFRCEPCSVSFRTKGHLQKHERSASHHNKLSSSPLLSSSEPRPFKCSDCNIAFRIHGHLAKHLRSKMHIMKLECLAKIPFGLYAELERANSLLTEINTTDGDQCLESLKILARKVFINDPSKLNQLEVSINITDTMDS